MFNIITSLHNRTIPPLATFSCYSKTRILRKRLLRNHAYSEVIWNPRQKSFKTEG